MLIFIKTQSGRTAANSFMDNLNIKNKESLTISSYSKDLRSLLKISYEFEKIIKIFPKDLIVIADCGCLKIFLILLLSSFNPKYYDKIYTTFYHHIIGIKNINIDFSRSEIWKNIGLKIYLKIIKVFKFKIFNFITVSEFTKNNLMSDFSINSENIYVLWNQFFKKNFNQIFLKRGEIKLNNKKPFILIITSFKKRKNISLIKKLAFKYGSKLKIVLPKPKNSYELSLYIYLKNLKVSLFNDLSQEEIIQLYLSTFCVLVPSLYEGLSLVPLEAISLSVPILLSDIDAHNHWELPNSFYYKNENINNLILKINKYLRSPKEIIDYSKYPLFIDKLKKASEERFFNLNHLAEYSKK